MRESVIALCLCAAFIAAGVWLLLIPACVSPGKPKPLASFELLTPEELKPVVDTYAQVAKVAAARLVREGRSARETIEVAATVLELAATDPTAMAGPLPLTRAFDRAGFVDEDVSLALTVVDIVLAQYFDLGSAEWPIGMNMRALLRGIAAGVRSGLATGATLEEEQAVAPIFTSGTQGAR